MLCPICNTRGGKRTGGSDSLQVWYCDHCQQNFPVYQEYPIHPQAVQDLADELVRCPACHSIQTEQLTDAPAMGAMRPYHCKACATLFPTLIADPNALGLDGYILSEEKEYYLPVHPQAMMDAVTQVDHLPSFFTLTQRLREYIEHTNFLIARTEDRVDMETQVREYSFYFVPDTWVNEHPERAGQVQAALSFSWHAGLAQYAGVPVTSVDSPIPIAISLGVLINPEQLERSLSAYLHLIKGLSAVLSTTEVGADSAIESELVVLPQTQEATIQRIAAIRRLSLDLTSADQWTMLILALPQQRNLLLQVWELVSGSKS